MLTLASRYPLNRKLAVLCGLSLVVAGLHGCLGVWISQQGLDMQTNAVMPPRLQVAYVSELQPAAPPLITPSPQAPPKVSRPKPRRPQPAPAPPAVSAASAPPLIHINSQANYPQPEFRHDADQAPAISSSPHPGPENPLQEQASSEPDQGPTEPASLAQQAISTPTHAGFNWPVSTRISYVLRGQYRGELNGSAQVEWLRQGDTYQVLMDIQTGLVFQRHMRSEGLISKQGLSPRKYQEQSKLLFKNSRVASMVIDAAGVLLPSGQRLAAPPHVQDAASQFIQLTYLFQTQAEQLSPGREIPLTIATPRHVTEWVYDVLQPETLDTPLGRLHAFQLRPRRLGPPRPHDLKTDVWFSPELQYLPIRIRIEQDDNNYIDLHIAKNPEIAN